MHSNSNNTIDSSRALPTLAAFKVMSDQEFAALGTDSIVFERAVTGAELAKIVPQAKGAPADASLVMIMAADGTPVLVTDNDEAIDEWLEEHDVSLVRRH